MLYTRVLASFMGFGRAEPKTLAEEAGLAVFVVTWNLNKERTNYSTARSDFIKHLERYEHMRDPGLDSVWFISTTNTANQIDEFLRQKLDDNDRLFVSKINRSEHQGWLAQNVWDWIQARQ